MKQLKHYEFLVPISKNYHCSNTTGDSLHLSRPFVIIRKESLATRSLLSAHYPHPIHMPANLPVHPRGACAKKKKKKKPRARAKNKKNPEKQTYRNPKHKKKIKTQKKKKPARARAQSNLSAEEQTFRNAIAIITFHPHISIKEFSRITR